MGSEPSREVWTGDTEIETEAVRGTDCRTTLCVSQKKNTGKSPRNINFNDDSKNELFKIQI